MCLYTCHGTRMMFHYGEITERAKALEICKTFSTHGKFPVLQHALMSDSTLRNQDRGSNGGCGGSEIILEEMHDGYQS